jgi:hypothetical protein
VGDVAERRGLPVACGQRRTLAPEANAVERYEVPIFITAQPNDSATVA